MKAKCVKAALINVGIVQRVRMSIDDDSFFKGDTK